jgi:long-subunit acyl-CoA synthetase (AMP-forming)
MKGYWKNEEATKHTFAEGGWFMTGDVAEVDKEGYFAIVDRVKELIKYKGFQGMSFPSTSHFYRKMANMQSHQPN